MRPLGVPFTRGREIGIIAALATAYFVTAKLGLRLAFVHPSATPVWPPTGIALASILLLGYGVWPGIFIGAFLANLTTAGTVGTSLGIATGNTLEALLGAYLVNRYANGRDAFDRPRCPGLYPVRRLRGHGGEPDRRRDRARPRRVRTLAGLRGDLDGGWETSPGV